MAPAPSTARALLLPVLLGTALLAAGTAAGAAAGDGPEAPREPPWAGQLAADTPARHRVGGPDAIAGLGDWALANGTVCAALADPSHETVLGTRGGVLVDLGHCGRDDDHFVLLQPLFNVSRHNIPPVESIRAESGPGAARIVTGGRRGGIRFVTTYEVRSDAPHRLRIRSVLERTARGPGLFILGDVVLHGGSSLQAFTLHTGHPEWSEGFSHPPVDPDSTWTMMRGIRTADLQVLVAGGAPHPGIAYGLWLREARVVPAAGAAAPARGVELPPLALNGTTFSILGVLAGRPRLGGGRIGLLELAQMPFLDLRRGQRLEVVRDVVVGDAGDVASVTNRVFAAAPRVAGRVDDARASLEVRRADGVPFTQVRPAPDGAFSLRAPPGRYVLRARADGRSAETPFAVEPDRDVAVPALHLGTPARLALPPGLAPVRLVFRGVGGTPDPVLRDDGVDLRFGGEDVPSSAEGADLFLAGLPGEPDEVVLPAGRYRVRATRGPAFTATAADVRLGAGERARLAIEAPRRVYATPGWLDADLHVHAAPSDDSTFPLRLRVASFAAEGVDVLVSSDHDRVTDYAPLLRELDLAGRMATLAGSEITTTVLGGETPWTAGHYNAFPLEPDPGAYREGVPAHEGRRLRAVLGDLAARPGPPLVQLNHPRAPGRRTLAFFTHLSSGRAFDPARPLERGANRRLVEPDPDSGLRDVDFDALELLNGEDRGEYARVRADWFSLLLQGEVRTATANSDTHTARAVAALPRNHVRVDGGGFRPRDFVEAVRAGRLCGSTGPFLEVELGGAGPGQRAAGRAGELTVRVRTAPWIPVSRARVFVNAERAAELPLRPDEPLAVPLRFARDAFVFVEVWGEPDEVYADLAPGFRPFAFCNPIFVDADGDGRWTPPGLPVLPPPALTRPDGLG